MAANGPQDFPKIHALQDQLKITPLSAWGKPYTPPSDVPLDPAVRKAINDVPAQIWMKFATGPFTMKAPNRWINPLNIGQFGTDYQTRAFVAYFGLLAGVKEDIIYPSAMVDSNGWPLDGGHRYVQHWGKADLDVSQNGVWSISQYRENFYVHNPIERYQIGSGMPLKYNPDGSLDVYIQANSPGLDKESNWLPLPPSGMVNLTIRIYNPKKEALDPAYKFPPVMRID